MLAMVMHPPASRLQPERRRGPAPGPGEVRLRVHACGVCRTDLHIVDGELPARCDTIVPGHEIVGVIDRVGAGVEGLAPGDRVGVPWLGGACGHCRACREGQENLCDRPEFTGWSRDGGYAEVAIARADFCIPIPAELSDADAAPLLCAGLIGYRAWRKAGEPDRVRILGIYGFGAAAHLLAQLATWAGQTVYAFTRPGDLAAQALARRVGCGWAGGSDCDAPEPLDAAILFAPDGALVPVALRAVRKGGVVVCGGIHMSDIPGFPYQLLWGERRLVSVANLTRGDAREYMALATRAGVRPEVAVYPLEAANTALDHLRRGAVVGAAVLVP